MNYVACPGGTLGPSYSQLYSTYQLISGAFHLLAPLDGAVELVLAQDLLLDGGCVLTPRRRLDQTLQTDRYTADTAYSIFSTTLSQSKIMAPTCMKFCRCLLNIIHNNSLITLVLLNNNRSASGFIKISIIWCHVVSNSI